MTDLVEFLRARLDKDEQMARAASPHAAADTWRLFISESHPAQWVIHDERGHRITHIRTAAADRGGVAQHAARHDLARVLREVEAKRRIVELHGIVHRNIGWLEGGDDEYDEIPVCGLCVPKHSHYRRREDVPEGPCPTLRLLALPHADHPDYREEWTP